MRQVEAHSDARTKNPETASLLSQRDGPPAAARHLKDFGGAFSELFAWRNWHLAVMFVWGVVTLILGVTVTILKQADVIKLTKD